MISHDLLLRSMGAHDAIQLPDNRSLIRDVNTEVILKRNGNHQTFVDFSRCENLSSSCLNRQIALNCKNLLYLDLSYTRLNDLSLIYFHCQHLLMLNVAGTELLSSKTKAGTFSVNLNGIEQLVSLEALCIRSSNVNDISALQENLPSIRYLDFGCTPLTEISAYIKHMVRLEGLLLDETSLYPEDLSALFSHLEESLPLLRLMNIEEINDGRNVVLYEDYCKQREFWKDFVAGKVYFEGSSRRRQFFEAVINNNAKEVHRLITSGQDINVRTHDRDAEYFCQLWQSRCNIQITSQSAIQQAPFFLVDHAEHSQRPSALHLAMYFHAFDALLLLIDYNINTREQNMVYFTTVDLNTHVNSSTPFPTTATTTQCVKLVERESQLFHTSNKLFNAETSRDKKQVGISLLLALHENNKDDDEEDDDAARARQGYFASGVKLFTPEQLLHVLYEKSVHKFTEDMLARKIANWKQVCGQIQRRLEYALKVYAPFNGTQRPTRDAINANHHLAMRIRYEEKDPELSIGENSFSFAGGDQLTGQLTGRSISTLGSFQNTQRTATAGANATGTGAMSARSVLTGRSQPGGAGSNTNSNFLAGNRGNLSVRSNQSTDLQVTDFSSKRLSGAGGVGAAQSEADGDQSVGEFSYDEDFDDVEDTDAFPAARQQREKDLRGSPGAYAGAGQFDPTAAVASLYYHSTEKKMHIDVQNTRANVSASSKRPNPRRQSGKGPDKLDAEQRGASSKSPARRRQSIDWKDDEDDDNNSINSQTTINSTTSYRKPTTSNNIQQQSPHTTNNDNTAEVEREASNTKKKKKKKQKIVKLPALPRRELSFTWREHALVETLVGAPRKYQIPTPIPVEELQQQQLLREQQLKQKTFSTKNLNLQSSSGSNFNSRSNSKFFQSSSFLLPATQAGSVQSSPFSSPTHAALRKQLQPSTPGSHRADSSLAMKKFSFMHGSSNFNHGSSNFNHGQSNSPFDSPALSRKNSFLPGGTQLHSPMNSEEHATTGAGQLPPVEKQFRLVEVEILGRRSFFMESRKEVIRQREIAQQQQREEVDVDQTIIKKVKPRLTLGEKKALFLKTIKDRIDEKYAPKEETLKRPVK